MLFISSLTAQVNDVGIYEHLNAVIPDDATFLNENGKVVSLKELITKPTVLSFVYYRCPGLCSPLLNGLAEVVDKCDKVLGKDYQVITISFNPEDTPSLAQQKKENQLKLQKKPVNPADWTWLTGDSININKVTNTVGFLFKKEGGEYAHGAAIIVLSPEGKITRYLYGVYFLPYDLKMALTDAAQGKSSPTIMKALKYCYTFDPEGKKYVISINRIAGAIVLLFALSFFLILVFKRKKSV